MSLGTDIIKNRKRKASYIACFKKGKHLLGGDFYNKSSKAFARFTYLKVYPFFSIL